MLLHSLLADRHAFDSVLPQLAEKHRVTLINLPGFHGSLPTPLALLDAYVAAIEDGYQEFGIGSDSILIGNGFGGTLALAFALAHPERVAKLVLSDAAAAFPPEGRAAFAAMASKVAEAGLGAIAEIAAKRVFSPAYLAAHPEKIEERKAVLMQIDPKAFQAACKILQEADLEPLLHRMKVPTFVVCGEFDQATPPALNKAIASKVPRRDVCRIARLRPLPAAGTAAAVLGGDQGFRGVVIFRCHSGTPRSGGPGIQRANTCISGFRVRSRCSRPGMTKTTPAPSSPLSQSPRCRPCRHIPSA